MFQHRCNMDDMEILGDRPNPLDVVWLPWALVICRKCKKVAELQIHSDEGMHGGALECTAYPGMGYVKSKYNLEPTDLDKILSGKKKARRYDRYKQSYGDA